MNYEEEYADNLHGYAATLTNTPQKENMKHTSLPFKAFIVFAAIVTAGALFHSSPAQGQRGTEDHDSRIEVNAVSTCNDCHSAGPQTQFAPGGNPFFGQPAKINPATYLGGGKDVGPLVPTPGYPHIVSRNLAPDRTGLPEGGRPFSEFLQILRTGMDLDHLHQTCSSTVATNCLPPPFDGNLLQIMSWPTFKNMTDYDIRAIDEHLSAIPASKYHRLPYHPWRQCD